MLIKCSCYHQSEIKSNCYRIWMYCHALILAVSMVRYVPYALYYIFEWHILLFEEKLELIQQGWEMRYSKLFKNRLLGCSLLDCHLHTKVLFVVFNSSDNSSHLNSFTLNIFFVFSFTVLQNVTQPRKCFLNRLTVIWSIEVLSDLLRLRPNILCNNYSALKFPMQKISQTPLKMFPFGKTLSVQGVQL